MLKSILCTTLILFCLTLSNISLARSARYEWKSSHSGRVPAAAIEAGKEFSCHAPRATLTDHALFICRANYEGGLYPGKVAPHLNGCSIAAQGKEILLSDYEVLGGAAFGWIFATNGDIPRKVFEAGQTAMPHGHSAYFICRAWFANGLHPGKLNAGLKGCSISWGGKEEIISSYEVLVKH